jgi:hypothetical protein
MYRRKCGCGATQLELGSGREQQITYCLTRRQNLELWNPIKYGSKVFLD